MLFGEKMAICRFCKQEIDDDAVFCPCCGKDLFQTLPASDGEAAPTEDDAAEEGQDPERRKRRRILALSAALALLVVAVVTGRATSRVLKNAPNPGLRGAETQTAAPETTEAKTAEPETFVEGTDVGNAFFIGSYPGAGDENEAIRWTVLKKEDGRLLLISSCALDCRRYNADYGETTWEACSLREWLNTAFFEAAFSPAEQSRIQSVTVPAGTNPDSGAYAGGATEDKIFLLSISEADTLFSSAEDRLCRPTAYAADRGVWVSAGGDCWWLLRSPGGAADSVAGVSYTGKIDTYGNAVDYANAGVRPAMWITADAQETEP